MNLETGISLFFAIFLFVITPGPGTFTILGTALNKGAKACLPLCFGLISADLVYLISACLGLAVIINKYLFLFFIVKIFGSIYIFYLGYKIIKSKPVAFNSQAKISKSNKFKKSMQMFSKGFLISISNPKVMLFYVAFLPNFINIKTLSAYDIGVLAIICTSSALFGAIGIAVTASYTRNFFTSEKSVAKLNLISGLVMILASIYLASTLIYN